ncbi:3-methyladenine DNA glycosylase [Tessaracoccus aquimaris]|uniref:Putative 3-methyladenine DNA glycosylase n=1 Tax=Tessaracoccus aquimaris TaxID=1332264 RepID=A0A1Q2CSK7_9ACTN|nr:3-methyladenine DNA glycosylase [Tessaracoccus aquimaris]
MLDKVAARARGLLGAHLSVERDDGRVTARIMEVEAYGGGFDPGSHAYRGPSARNAAMFGPPLHAYVYRHMGLHTCFNVVVAVDGTPTGVLIRAGEIVEGLEAARARRSAKGRTRSDNDLAAGPARLTVALGITLADVGAPLDGSTGITLTPRPGPEPTIASGPRIGLGKATDFPLRFWIEGDPSVSR